MMMIKAVKFFLEKKSKKMVGKDEKEEHYEIYSIEDVSIMENYNDLEITMSFPMEGS